ncbi:response regulator [Deinococcus humi]|uniref:CheY-like chemotaxis protein n=1 Tax=Deinococcus humi TaxID=662880 RepID=A0A7W8K248_9DEIO|nr:response regulator [Deinococcus humi]MBB5366183.1 CheY-like chemotaxis protein [Deinococcus humi]GGO40777.1 response regulator [Deinococcus humi]
MTSHRHYLLVDDNLQDRMLAQEAFEQLRPECVLTCVGSGREALELLYRPEFQPDVVLLDLNMPGMSGFEVLTEMKQDARLVHIPVVILSTSSAQKDVELAYILHASSYLVKSVSFHDFLEQLEKVLHYWQISHTVRNLTSRSEL